MAGLDYELPSFSLGLDSDCDSPPASPKPQPNDPAPDCSGDDDGDFQSADHPPRTLQRLRRGPRLSPAGSSLAAKIDDDIEEFSSEEEIGTVGKPSARYHSLCSSSKLPLSRGGKISTDLGSRLKSAKPKQSSNDTATTSQQASSSRLLQTSTANSPIRRFVLVDSDSDDPLLGEEARKNGNGKSSRGKTQASFDKPSREDLWKDFCPMKSSRIATPAFDDFCNEYFRPVKEYKNQSQQAETCSSLGDDVSCLRTGKGNKNVQNPLLPSHQYFFHDDPRIRNLVWSRLAHFFPLGGGNPWESEHPYTSAIDYMSQFSNGEPSQKRGTRKKKGSGARVKAGVSNSEEPMDVDGWVNPRTSVTLPTNAGKRRVHANGKSAGHWYTGPDGRKVYVTGNGQELTGSAAYRNYKKESGTGFRKSRKKPKATKKAKR